MSSVIYLMIMSFFNEFLATVFSARCNIYISRLCYDVSVCLSVRLSVTEMHWRIIANLGFKFRSHFTAHCGRRAARRAACGRIISRHASQCQVSCYTLAGNHVNSCFFNNQHVKFLDEQQRSHGRGVGIEEGILFPPLTGERCKPKSIFVEFEGQESQWVVFIFVNFQQFFFSFCTHTQSAESHLNSY